MLAQLAARQVAQGPAAVDSGPAERGQEPELGELRGIDSGAEQDGPPAAASETEKESGTASEGRRLGKVRLTPSDSRTAGALPSTPRWRRRSLARRAAPCL